MLVLGCSLVIPEVAWTGQPVNYQQQHFRWGEDAAVENWLQDEDTTLGDLDKETPIRLRFLVQNNGGDGTPALRLEVAETGTCGSESYLRITDGSETHWDLYDSSHFSNGASTSDSTGLTNPGSGSFAAGQYMDTADQTGTISLVKYDFTEVEFSIQATSSATAGETYCFRLTDNGTELTGYDQFATVTIIPDPHLTLADHDSGQVGDKVVYESSVTDVVFYRFNLTRANDVTVTDLDVHFTTGDGVGNDDVTNAELWEDTNGNGEWDDTPTDTLIQDTGVTISGGIITFTTDFQPDTSGTNYLVLATVSSLEGTDTTTFSMDTTDITTDQGDLSGSATDATHTYGVNINYRSIGTSTDNLLTGSPTMDISSGRATLDAEQTGNIGIGDKITYNDTVDAYITNKIDNWTFDLEKADGTPADDVTDATVNSIYRSYNTIQTWEADRDGDLVGDDRREVGVCYADGTFTLTGNVDIDDSVTDEDHYMHLTVAEGNRHAGKAGADGTANVIVDANGTEKKIRILDDYTRIEWIEYKGMSNAPIAYNTEAFEVTSATNVLLEHLLIHGCTDSNTGDSYEIFGVATTNGNQTSSYSYTLRNSIIYNENADPAEGIYLGAGGGAINDVVTVENVTFYRMGWTGFKDRGTLGSNITIRNTIAMGSLDGPDIELLSGSRDTATLENIISSDDTGTTGLTYRTATANPDPGTGDWVVFTNISSGTEDFHLQDSTENDALNAGTDLSSSFTDDIDGETRPTGENTWDIGADEFLAVDAVTVGSTGNQTASLLIASTDNYVGGAFTFVRDTGSADVSRIVLSETSSVDANADLSNVRLYYETAGTCSYDGNETLLGAGWFNSSEQAIISGFVSATLTYEGGGSAEDHVQDVAMDAAGNIYAAGWKKTGSNFDWVIRKYGSDGALCDGSGSCDAWGDSDSGMITYVGAGNDDKANGIVVDSSDNIYVAGPIGSGLAQDFAVRKYDADGDPDTTWGDNGMVTYEGVRLDVANAIAIDSDNASIYVGGFQEEDADGPEELIVLKYDATTGDLCNGSGSCAAWGDSGSGMIVYNSGAYPKGDQAAKLVLDGDKNLYVTGTQGNSDDSYDWVTLKYDATGDLCDGSGSCAAWGDSGSGKITESSPGILWDWAKDIVIDTSRNIYVAGYQNTDWAVIKYDANGDRDTTWGDNDSGKIEYTSGGTDSANGIAIDASNNIYVAGYKAGNGNDWLVRKYDANGDLDTTWGTSGEVFWDSDPGQNYQDEIHAIAIDPARNIIVAGFQGSNGDDWAIRKYDPDGVEASNVISVGTSQVCVYVVLDVGSGAGSGDLLGIAITDPSADVTVSDGTVGPGTPVTITGTTTLSVEDEVIVSSTGSQTASLIIPSTNNYVGGAFTFVRSTGSANVTQIVLSETNSVDANSDLSNVRLYYETAGTCSYDGGETLFGTAASFDGSDQATVSGTMTVGASQVCVYVVLDVGSGAGSVNQLDIEISNPSTDVTVSAGTVSPGTAVEITGTTTLGNHIYVDGSWGGTESGTETEPFSTIGGAIAEAISEANPPYTIHIKGDHTYTEQVSIPAGLSGSSGNVTTFQKWAGSEANPIVFVSWSGTGVLISADYIIWDSIDVTSGLHGIDISGDNITIQNSTIYGCSQKGIRIVDGTGASNTTIRSCTIRNSFSLGIDIQGGSSGTTVDHCIISNNGSSGIRIYTTGANNVIYNNTFDGNLEGIQINNASVSYIYNNIVSNNTNRGIWDLDGTYDPNEDYNCAYNNPSGNYAGFTQGSHSIETNPLFVDRDGDNDTYGDADDNFHLQSEYGYYPWGVDDKSDPGINSPCIDAGQVSGDYSAYSNEPEDNGSQVNMGAYGNTIEASLSGPATAVTLLSLTAQGDHGSVKIAWQTGREAGNKGFHLYQAAAPQGAFTRLTEKLIPGAGFMTAGRAYSFTDTDVVRGALYYYKLEDIDVAGNKTLHGPVCVDWDGDGLPDDWELALGLNADLNDADLDPDGDGLTNLQEYLRGVDPYNPDSDGDGILDGLEAGKIERSEANGSQILSRGVEVLAADESGLTLELRTEGFGVQSVFVDGEEFERLRIAGYIHGYTQEVGRPQLPVKGILLDVPAGKAAQVSVLHTEVEPYHGFRVYPVPRTVAAEQGDTGALAEVFAIDEAFYRQEGFYPAAVASAGARYVFRDQAKHQILFYPLCFNPATGDLTLYTRIRLRVDYVAAAPAEDSDPPPVAWRPSTQDSRLKAASALPATNMAFIGTPLLLNPLAPILASLQALLGAWWAPPVESLTEEMPAYKILTSAEGIYQLTAASLAGAGINTAVLDLSQIRLYCLGAEVPLDIYDANANQRLDDGDYILFYGQAVDSRYAKYSAANVYWLTPAGGEGAPQRMGSLDGMPAGAVLAGDFDAVMRHEADQFYGRSVPGADGLDRWFFTTYVPGDGWDKRYVPNAGDPVLYTVPLPRATGPGTLSVMLFSDYDQEHAVQMLLNGVDKGSYSWSGRNYRQIDLAADNLIDGDNTLSLTCTSGEDALLLDWVQVTYGRDFTAAGNSLKIAHDPAARFEVSNLSGSQYFVFDITDAADVKRVTGFAVSGSGPYSLQFEPPTGADDTRTYFVAADAALKTPDSIAADTAANLGDAANGADYILITHRDLGWDENGDAYDWLDDLVALRQAQGLRVKVVDVADIFDEFSYGLVTPEAMRDFISYAYENWQAPAPQYVLLVGDHTYDYKDNDGGGSENFVPAYLAHTAYLGETVTDEYFVRISGSDAVPDLYIGRLPAASHTEAAVMVKKIVDYEQAPNTKTWQRDTLLAADNQTQDYEAVFELISEDAAALLPQVMNVPTKAYLNDYIVARDLTVDIKSAFDNGSLIINYSGHGGYQVWADERIFDVSNGWPGFYYDVDDLRQLSEENKGRYPFVISMSCLTGYFGGLDAWENPSLMEALLRAENKGAAAALMPTGETATEGQHILNTALFESLFTEDIRRLGPVILAAKQTLLANGSASYEQVSETFLLFGDPAMSLKIPLPYRPTGLTGLRRLTGSVELSWQAATDCNGSPAAGYNIYRTTTPGQNYVKLNAAPITATEFVDDSFVIDHAVPAASASDTTYYYAVTTVDADGDESPLSSELSPIPEPVPPEDNDSTQTDTIDNTNTTDVDIGDTTTNTGSSSGGGGGAACFISTAAVTDASMATSDFSISSIFGLLALIGLLWLGRKKKGKRSKAKG
jgi:uncharacterized delta-60 repeat protein